MKIVGLTIVEFAAGIVGLAALVMFVLKGYKEWKAQSKGLAPNPTRCEDHEARLRGVEHICTEVGTQLDSIQTDVKTLLALHIKP